MEPIYRVSFFKKLTDSTGHSADACQGIIDVHASSQDRAIGAARIMFAELKQVPAWSLRADYEKIEFLPERRRVARRRELRMPGNPKSRVVSQQNITEALTRNAQT